MKVICNPKIFKVIYIDPGGSQDSFGGSGRSKPFSSMY